MKVLILFLLFSNFSVAGESGRAGNGGGGLFCKNGKAQLLDYYEAEFNEVHTFNYLKSLNSSQRKQLFFDRIERHNPTFYAFVLAAQQKFDSQKEFLSHTSFKIPDDYRTIVYERSCELKVVAVQVSENLPGENIFFIDKELWNQFGEIDREGLVHHEVLYYIARNSNEDSTNSRLVRQALAYLLSDQYIDDSEIFRQKFIEKVVPGFWW